MSKSGALFKMSNRNNLENVVLLITYILTLAIVLAIGGVICANAVFPALAGNPEATDADYAFAVQTILLGIMCIGMAVCYSVIFAVPMTKDKANGNIESLLAASADIKDIWMAKTWSLFLISFITTIIFVAVSGLLVKVLFIPADQAIVWDLWYVLTIFVATPLVYFSECLLINLIGLCFSTDGGTVFAAIFGIGFMVLTINIVARKTLNPRNPVLFIVFLVIAVILLIISFILYGKVDKEKVVLSCKAAGATVKKGHK